MSQIPPPSPAPAGTVESSISPAQLAAPAPTAPGTLRMANVAAVNWSSVLEFTQLFRGFRLAISPAKVLLALLAILAIYTAGRGFDAVWGPQVYDGEIENFTMQRPEQYRATRTDELERRRSYLRGSLVSESTSHLELTSERIQYLVDHPGAGYRALKKIYEQKFHESIQRAHADRVDAEKNRPAGLVYESSVSPAEQENLDRANAADSLFTQVQHLKANVGQSIFEAFMIYEIREFDALVENTLTFVRVSPVRSSGQVEFEGSAVSGGLLSKNPGRLWQSDTVVGCIANMTITGPMWLFSGTAPMQWRPAGGTDTWGGWIKMVAYRGLYLASLLAFTVFSLVIMAFAGATIARLSALEMAGIERAPLKDVMLFAVRRLWVFVKAPVTPFLILLAIGLLMGIAGLVGAIPFIGEILLGVLFILLIAVAFVMMLLLLGILGGFHLLYPTIAVEGSDAFDAMSRAFAYVYARPWRLLFYSVVSLIYGVITFLFVSFAIYLVLLLTHTFVGWGTSLFGYNHGWYTGLPKLETLWATPELSRLGAPANWYAMSWTEYIGALFLHFWVYMLVTCIGAYVISYYFSTHTIIYLLLRRSVDGQSTNEVFLEDGDAAALAPASLAASVPQTAR
ncbi:MAG: hypothetical protein ACTHN5_18730 [Phycisphaerae bacterium]